MQQRNRSLKLFGEIYSVKLDNFKKENFTLSFNIELLNQMIANGRHASSGLLNSLLDKSLGKHKAESSRIAQFKSVTDWDFGLHMRPVVTSTGGWVEDVATLEILVNKCVT